MFGLVVELSPRMYRDKVWLSAWVDYSNRYGLGFLTTDNCHGVIFNDGEKLVLAPNQVFEM